MTDRNDITKGVSNDGFCKGCSCVGCADEGCKEEGCQMCVLGDYKQYKCKDRINQKH